jgi:hypothetical protein
MLPDETKLTHGSTSASFMADSLQAVFIRITIFHRSIRVATLLPMPPASRYIGTRLSLFNGVVYLHCSFIHVSSPENAISFGHCSFDKS